MEVKSSNITKPLFWYLFLIAIILLGADLLGAIKGVRAPFERTLQPLAFYGLDLSLRLTKFKETFTNFSKNQQIIEGLKVRVNQLETKNADYEVLQEKYNSLLEHSKVADKKYEYVQAGVYIPADGSNLILNIGSKDGIKIGDVVVIGNVYIGTISTVDENSSEVRTAENSGSILEVQINSKGKNITPVRAIATGQNHEVIIENILSSSQVANGDTVLVADKKVGGYLVLGKVSGLNQDRAASVLTAKVTPEIDLFLNKFVFVRK